MDLVNRITLYIVWTRIKKWLWLPLTFVALLVVYNTRRYINNTLPTITNFLQDPVAATLIGAVIGGALAFYGSIYVQRAQIRSLAAIRRRDEIFIPIYNELLALRKSLNERPCPYEFAFESKDNHPYSPRFTVWPSFKDDSRSLQVPNPLATSLDQFVTVINSYTTAWKTATDDGEVDKIIRKIIVSNFGDSHSQRMDLTYHFLACNSELHQVIEMLESAASEPDQNNRLVRTATDEQIQRVAVTLYRECTTIDSVIKLRVARKGIDNKLAELIMALELTVKFINEEFEQHAQWF